MYRTCTGKDNVLQHKKLRVPVDSAKAPVLERRRLYKDVMNALLEAPHNVVCRDEHVPLPVWT